MIVDPKPNKDRSADRQRALRSGAAILVVVLFLGGLILLVDFADKRPDFYQPARSPITEAVLILSETYGEEKELLKKLGRVHRQLENAIALLGQAERLAPEDKQQIETLRMRLQALEDIDFAPDTDPRALQRTYQDLTEQLSALAENLAQNRQ